MTKEEREEDRVLACIDQHGDVADHDLPILRRLIDQRRVRECSYEDYVGFERVPA